MYVCLCNALTDRDVRARIDSGGSSVAMVYRACGCEPRCGKCIPYIRQILRETGDDANSARLGVTG
ncbi:MAG TPA: (2Fe-2S)-binding protein [Stellaceae bacterium]|nr:(2Fe-2S)-binding protein [Stellaceae bacterium]